MKLANLFLDASLAFLVVFLIACQCGCTTRPRYVEGTMTLIGLYIPIESSIYGLQCLNYLNGCSLTAASNLTLHVEREFASTNSYFGIISTIEHSKTKADVK